MKKIKNVTVLGAGSMGALIAALAAEAGYSVKVRDIEEKFLDRGRQTLHDVYDRRISRGRMTEDAKKEIMDRLTFLVDVKDAVKDADIIIEAVPEIMDLKKSVLKETTALCPDDCVFATNTSSLSIAEIATAAKKPEMVVGTHYFNPPSRMTLLEIVHGTHTSKEAIKIAEKVAIAMNRAVVHVTDVPGFIANRILLPMINEAVYCLYHSVGTREDIDTVMKLGMNHPMGPLALADLIGLDTCLAVMETLHDGFKDSKYRPCPLLRKYVEAGWLGRKTKKGFFEYK